MLIKFESKLEFVDGCFLPPQTTFPGQKQESAIWLTPRYTEQPDQEILHSVPRTQYIRHLLVRTVHVYAWLII